MVDLTDQTLLLSLGDPHMVIVRCTEDPDHEYVPVSHSHEWDALTDEGWQIDRESRFSSPENHRCPTHAIQFWVTWCADPDCGACMSNHERIIMAPLAMIEDEVTSYATESKWVCNEGNRIIGAEAMESASWVKADFSVPFPPNDAPIQAERLV